ncbi:hypothetical protein BKA69DRAFT_928817 [Paraphysoderma sedebokerense]|nr:hypothetical protein BKA69DRAFT_928817 [Paraphysoderma sedebokerense]
MKVDDVDYDGRLSVKITNLRINGTLYHVNRQSGANSGLAVGEGSEISGPPYQVIYVPAKDFASTTPDMLQRFNVSFSDSGTNNVTNSEEIVFPVVPINDAPQIDCTSPYIVLPQENLNYPYTVTEFQISAYDIDDTDLSFYVSSLPIRGVLMDVSTANPISVNTAFNNTNLSFNSSGTAGGNPYGNFTIYAKDPHGGESARCTFQFTVNCPPGLVNNVLRNVGPICVACPSGAVCSQDGITPARARPGYWLSDDKVTFLPCSPKEACPGTAENSCSPGYKGIRCGQCDRNYYKLANLCQKCPTNASTKLFIVAGILVVAGILLLLFVRYSKGPILGLFGILVNFLQSIILLQHLHIEWPQEFYDLLSRLSIVNINVEVASPECFSSDLIVNFSLKLKIALLSPLLLGGIAMLYFSFAWFIRKSIYQFQPAVVRNWVKAEFKQLGKVLHTLLNILYVHVTTSSLSLFDCYQSPDGYYYLEADPSLRCYETWYIHDLPYAIVGTCIYVIGIPLYFSAIYFLLHQKRYTTRFFKESRLLLEELMTSDKNYKREYQFYGVLQLYHKLAVILVNVFLTKYEGFQIIFTQVLLLIWLQLFLRYRPFISDTLNRLEISSHICILSVLGAGLPFRLDGLDPGNPLQKVLVVFITLVICGFIFLVLIATLGEVWSKLKQSKESRGQKNEDQSRYMYPSSVILLPAKLQ